MKRFFIVGCLPGENSRSVARDSGGDVAGGRGIIKETRRVGEATRGGNAAPELGLWGLLLIHLDITIDKMQIFIFSNVPLLALMLALRQTL